MPYYTPRSNIELPLDSDFLFIHIPKTGGTSFENYLKTYYIQTFHGKRGCLHNVSWQHQTFLSLKEVLISNAVDLNNLKVFSIVRNPYSRLISELFYNKHTTERASFLQANSNTLDDLVEEYLNKDLNYLCDNHFLPQYKFLVDEHEVLLKNLTIFNTENLTSQLKSFGFKEYKSIRENKRKARSKSREHMLGDRSIKLVNEVYKKDFELFGYKQL